MELEDYKSIWQQHRFKRKSEQEIAAMLHTRSKSIVAVLKRNAWIELCFTVAGTLTLLYVAFSTPEEALKRSFLGCVIVFVLYVVYYLKKIQLLNRFDQAGDTIKLRLEKTIDSLTVYLKFYRWSYTLTYPLLIPLILYITWEKEGSLWPALQKPEVLCYLGIALTIILICLLWFTNWYMQKLYGNHLEKLKQLLNELREDAWNSN